VKEGVLSATQNPLDKRERLIPATALQELRERRGPRERPWPRTIGIVSDGSVPSSEIEEYMREHWKPDW
jgi:hypothetical protein